MSGTKQGLLWPAASALLALGIGLIRYCSVSSSDSIHAEMLAAATAPAQEETAVLEIGSRLELFVDDYLIGTATNVTQELHHPEAQEFSFAFDMPWEGPYSGAATVFKDGDLFRFYYRAMHPDEPEVTCYAESRDGIAWTKPTLDLFDYHGSTDNNIIMKSETAQEGGYSHNFAPFRDPNPAAPDNRRYKAVCGGSALYGFVSADGIHWRKIQEDPIITQGPFDTLNVAFYDELRGQYVCYMREWTGVRHVRFATSSDFVNWTPAQSVDFGDAPPEHIYTNAVRPYFRAPQIYMGFPFRLVEERVSEVDRAINEHGVADGVFMTSRDQLHFHRWLGAFVRPGLDPGNWMQRSNVAAWGMLPTSPEEISLYYTEHYYQPTNRVRRYTIRTDGFVSMHAGFAGGEFVTKPLTFEGRELVINYSTSAVGSVRVEVQDEAGTPLDGFALGQCPEIFGDAIKQVVAWERGPDVRSLAGKTVRLRFALKDADVYSIRFRP